MTTEIYTSIKNEIFAAYLGCNVAQFINSNDAVFGKLVGIERNKCWILMDDDRTQSWAFYDDSKLMLKPLSAISHLDAAYIIKKSLTISSEVYIVSTSLKYGILVIEWSALNYNGGIEYYDVTAFRPKYLDYFRSKGYDCGYREIVSLIEAGIAIINTK